MSETATAGARYRIGAYRFWQRHVAILLAGTPDPDHVAALLPELGEQRTVPACSASPAR
ncbi:hypothetical protein ACIQU4_09540 [Streptomyces sp. NPDC090741]|uniref:hypothetical protein n=1 Tax=Streptomyces sp. NPDC090741 TaxID=3365967 RepID=UPI0038173E05